MSDINHLEILAKIDASQLDYDEWINVGKALKCEGYDWTDWDSWSQWDPRYKAGECQRKWAGFTGRGITGATLTQYAKDQGATFGGGYDGPHKALTWESMLSNTPEDSAYRFVDHEWLEGADIQEPGDNWDPIRDIRRYLNALFSPSETFGYVTDCWETDDGRSLPTKGVYHITVKKILDELERYKRTMPGEEIACAFSCTPATDHGAWVRFNPLDGEGVKDANVVDHRYALVESDVLSVGKQKAIYEQLELPIAALVHSGGIYLDPDVTALVKLPTSKKEWVDLHEMKLDALEELVEELQGSPLLVAYDFKHDLARIQKRFGKDVPYIGGGVSVKRSMELEQAWNRGELPLLFGHPQSIAHGLNLQQVGQHVAWHTLTWDYELYDQFIRRVRRQGSKARRVFVHHILAEGTIDEVILGALKMKRRGQNALFSALKKLKKS